MAIITNDTIVAVNYESTEGTVAVPASATDGYIAVKAEGFTIGAVSTQSSMYLGSTSQSIGNISHQTEKMTR